MGCLLPSAKCHVFVVGLSRLTRERPWLNKLAPRRPASCKCAGVVDLLDVSTVERARGAKQVRSVRRLQDLLRYKTSFCGIGREGLLLGAANGEECGGTSARFMMHLTLCLRFLWPTVIAHVIVCGLFSWFCEPPRRHPILSEYRHVDAILHSVTEAATPFIFTGQPKISGGSLKPIIEGGWFSAAHLTKSSTHSAGSAHAAGAPGLHQCDELCSRAPVAAPAHRECLQWGHQRARVRVRFRDSQACKEEHVGHRRHPQLHQPRRALEHREDLRRRPSGDSSSA
ncbi:hypothetical protein B0H11DRAFT_1923902 [Mycena galericulata]|nr:hypothetical protein B0H11DRAFT_1923902 [Mycena galericulata]